jgi:O-antigen/teichoic acid export membrane protein
VAFIVVLAPELTRVFLGERFQAAGDFVFWGALAETTRILVGIYSLIAHVYMRTQWLIIPGSVGAGLSIILCVLLIPILGAHGVGMGLAIAGLAAFISMQLLLVPRVGGGVPLRPVLLAGAAGGMLWWVALIGRHLMAMEGWTALICILLLVGSVYIGAQYLFLRRHLLEKENM